jgi:hypothetical protein
MVVVVMMVMIMSLIRRHQQIIANSQLQIFHLTERRLIKEYLLEEKISFWKWISANTIAIVGENAVYHWSLEGIISHQTHLLACSVAGDMTHAPGGPEYFS